MIAEQQQLDELGYLVLPNIIAPPLLAALRTRVEALFAEEGERAGAEFKQEPQLPAAGQSRGQRRHFPRRWSSCRRCSSRCGTSLGPEIKLSSLNARSANPHSTRGQPLHADMGALPDARGYWVCNTVWMLDDFTTENGATPPRPGLAPLAAAAAGRSRRPAGAAPGGDPGHGPAGTVVVMNSHLWHGGTANRTAAPRTGLHAFYCRRDKPQQQYQKQMLRPEVQRRCRPRFATSWRSTMQRMIG